MIVLMLSFASQTKANLNADTLKVDTLQLNNDQAFNLCYYSLEYWWAYGRNSIKVGDSRWYVKAARPSSGHGMSVDLIIADEVFGIDSETLDIGLLPTQRARPNPLCSMWSTAGTEDSIAMLRWREQGIRAIDSGEVTTSVYLAEYSPPPDLDPMSEAAWEYANPALGHTLDILHNVKPIKVSR